ncbi:MAG TPA: transglycosylase SLT domain-containing protein, partial [Burkholderiales bacterium]|nr:transglycosylase SLT domain-containing protein [Burkholderiales bacterium]
MTKRALAAAAALLVQACASTPPAEPQPQNIPAAPQPSVQPQAANPKPAPTPPAQPPAGSAVLDTAKLQPFEGERRDVAEPLRGVRKVDRTAQADDLWQRVRQGFAMPDLDNDLVRKQTAYYASRPEYLQRMFDRSRIYLYHIVDELEKRNLPTELALLPMVESAFNPMAYSRAHASGLWQFIPGTGRRFELQQNWWYDGRRDIVESTKAALDYLTFLYEMHGDWHLALASYNWGEGAVARAIAQNR